MTDFLPGFRGRDRYGGYVVLAVDGDDRLVRYDDGREARRSVVLLRLAHRNREFDADRAPVAPPPLGHGPDRLLLNAPGSYVLQT